MIKRIRVSSMSLIFRMALKKLFAVLLMLLLKTAASVDYDDDYEGSGADVDPCWVRLYKISFTFILRSTSDNAIIF